MSAMVAKCGKPSKSGGIASRCAEMRRDQCEVSWGNELQWIKKEKGK
jgi:hypothetical protein